MAYKIIVSPRAQKEIENAIDYYALYSFSAPKSFISMLSDSYNTLEANPFFNIQYKNIRALKIRKFPYSLYYTVNETQNIVRILACFHMLIICFLKVIWNRIKKIIFIGVCIENNFLYAYFIINEAQVKDQNSEIDL